MMTTYLVNRPEVISETTDLETVVIHLGTGHYFSLKGSASAAWLLIEEQVSEPVIKARFLVETDTRHDQAPNNAIKAIDTFLQWLVQHDLVKVVPTDQAGSIAPQAAPALDHQDLVYQAFDDMQDLLGLDPIHEANPDQGWPHAGPAKS